MIAIGNGETCPFCKGDYKFVANPRNDFFKHLIDKHPVEMDKALFGGKDVGM